MTLAQVTPRRVLAVADTSETQLALRSALALAEAQGALLETVAVMEPPPDLAILARLLGQDPDRLIAQAMRHTCATVQARRAECLAADPPELPVVVGKAYLQIIRHAAKTGCDFVIKTAEPLSGVNRFFSSSTDQHLLRKCPCPVWLQTPMAAPRPKRIIAAVDLDLQDAAEPETLSGLNRRVVHTACMIAKNMPEVDITVLHAWDAPGEGMVWALGGGRDPRVSADQYVNAILDARSRAMEQLLTRTRKEVGPRPRLRPSLLRGAPETVIHDLSRLIDADLVVMGTVARTGPGGVFIGNTAENMLNRLECPVLAVKPEGFISPVLRG